MILWMLRRLEINPHATFAERELAPFGGEFESAKRAGLIRSLSLVDEVQLGDRRLAIVTDEDGAEAIDEDDPALDPMPMEPHNLRSWRLDVPEMISVLRDGNGLTGPSGSLSERLWLLGEAGDAEDGVCVVLALLHDERQAITDLHSLPSIAPPGATALVVVCPTYAPSAAALRGLASLSIAPTSFADGSLAIDWSRVHAPVTPLELTHGPGYRSVVACGRTYTFSKSQALVVGVLHSALRSGAPDVAWTQIRPQLLAIGANPTRMRDVFKRAKGWQDLIVSTRPGFYRLNLAT
jgi:hypothetical protein